MSNKKRAGGFWSSFPVHLKRMVRLDLDPGTLLPDEAEVFAERAAAGTPDSPPLRRLLLWRRSMVYIALFLMVPTVAMEAIDTLIVISDTPQLGALGGLQFLVVLCNLGLCAALYFAWARWEDLATSRKRLFLGWLIAFSAPFLIALFPIRSLADGAAPQQALALGLIGSMSMMTTLAPKAVSLIPGLLRAAIVTKVLFPGSTAPGWLIMTVAPLYVLLVFVVMLMPYQIGGSVFMLLGLLAFVAAPVFLWRVARKLAQPMAADEALSTIKGTRVTTLTLNAAGGLFLLIGLIDLMGELQLGVLEAIQTLLALVANITVLSVVATDAVNQALRKVHESQHAPGFADGYRAYQSTLTEFLAAQDATTTVTVDTASPPASPPTDSPTE